MSLMCINRSLFWKNEIIEITIFQQSMFHYTFEHLKKEKNPRILIFSRKEIFHLIENTRWILTRDVRNLASAIMIDVRGNVNLFTNTS